LVSKDVMDKLRTIGLEAVEKRNFELVDLEFVNEAGIWYLRYYIDKDDGITLDDCQEVSKEISRKLDIIDPIPFSYSLEVSSPGVERPLKREKDFLRYLGSMVQIKTYEPIENKKVFTGILKDYSDGVIIIEDGKDYTIPRLKISSARLKFNWNGV
jgi:ribosome maturation factor RimP